MRHTSEGQRGTRPSRHQPTAAGGDCRTARTPATDRAARRAGHGSVVGRQSPGGAGGDPPGRHRPAGREGRHHLDADRSTPSANAGSATTTGSGCTLIDLQQALEDTAPPWTARTAPTAAHSSARPASGVRPRDRGRPAPACRDVGAGPRWAIRRTTAGLFPTASATSSRPRPTRPPRARRGEHSARRRPPGRVRRDLGAGARALRRDDQTAALIRPVTPIEAVGRFAVLTHRKDGSSEAARSGPRAATVSGPVRPERGRIRNTQPFGHDWVSSRPPPLAERPCNRFQSSV